MLYTEWQHPMAQHFIWRIMSEYDYHDKYQTIDYAHQLQLSHKISAHLSATYKVGQLKIHNETASHKKIFIAIEFRQRRHQDWGYLSVPPEIYRNPIQGVGKSNEDNDEQFSLTEKLTFFFAQ